MQREVDPNDSRSNAQQKEKEPVIPFVAVQQRSNLAAVRTTVLLHPLSSSNLYCGLVVCGGRAHSLLDLAGHGQEGLLDVASVLGGGLKEWDAEAVSEFLQIKY